MIFDSRWTFFLYRLTTIRRSFAADYPILVVFTIPRIITLATT